MFSNIPKLLTFLFLLLNMPLHGQEIWRESFDIPEKGIWGDENGVIQSDFTAITQWSLDFSNVVLSNPDDYAKTVSTSGGRFECRDINGEVIWYSETIDISDYKNVQIQLLAQETGSGANEETKYLKSYYQLDNNDKTPFEWNGENSGNWGIDTAMQSGLNGENLRIVVHIATSYSSDKVILDEIVVSGEEKNPVVIEPGDVLINEVLFNPFPEAADYVEIYNYSEKEIPLNRLFLASRDGDLELTQVYILTHSKEKFVSGNYIALTADTSGVFPWFNIKCPECVVQMEKFPSFNNDKDDVVLVDENMQIIDELHYSDKMHSPLLADEEGVSLERIALGEETNNPANWHSASTASGYGTPGYENSQIEQEDLNEPVITFSPESFSPNFDGFNDEYQIHYEMEQPGYIANVWIFDSVGRLVIQLAQNEILGTQGDITWNGEDETGQRQQLGVYIALVEIFNTQGKVQKFKDGVVLTDILE